MVFRLGHSPAHRLMICEIFHRNFYFQAMRKVQCIFFLTFLFATRLLFSQSLHFETFNTRNGLSSNEITCVYEDQQHFLWVGTRDGLNRFDGRRFETFRNIPDDTNSLSGNLIVDIIQDEQGIFWIATKDGGLTRYDEKEESSKQFRQFKSNPKKHNSIATNRLNCLFNWDSTYLVIGAESVPGIFINKKTFEITYWNFDLLHFTPYKGAPVAQGQMNWIHHIEEVNGKVYFSILTNSKIYRVDKRTGTIEDLRTTPEISSSIPDFFVANNKIWMAGWNPDLYVQDNRPGAEQEKIGGINDLLMCVTDYNQLYLLAGTRSSGLFRVNKNNRTLTQYKRRVGDQSSLPSNKVSCVFKDSRDIIWVGTAAGLAKYDEKTWLFSESEFTDAQTDLSILHTHRFDDGSVAVNTSKGMFLSDTYEYLYDQLNFKNRNRDINPDYLCRMSRDTFLLGTEIGFYKWVKGTKQLKELPVRDSSTTRDNFYDISVYQVKDILPDTVNGNPGYWMAVLGYGISFYSTEDEKLYSFLNDKSNSKSIGSNLAHLLAKDNRGNLWIATSYGLYQRKKGTPLTENTFTGFLNEPENPLSLPGNDIAGLWCDPANHIWFSVSGQGLCEYADGKFHLFAPDNTVSSLRFMGLHADHRHRLWIITKNGLEVFDLTQKKFFHVDVNDGSFNTLLSGQFSNETDGKISFAAGNTLFSFTPDVMKFESEYPEIFLASMNVLGKEYLYKALHGTVSLNPREKYINFSVSALQFTAPQTVRFQYRLEGMEDSWNNSDNGEIKYTNLPAGNFKLLVRVTNPSGHYGGQKELAFFHIAAPFYSTWWFILSAIALISTIIFAGYRYRLQQVMKLQAIRNKIARDLHDDIGSTLGSISFLSEAAKLQLAQENSRGAEKLLLKIGENSREMVDNMSDIVWSVNPKNDTVRFLIDRMNVFAGDLVASSGIQLHFHCDRGVKHVKLSMEQRKNFFLIFKETVYNSVKYSGCTTLTIEMKKSTHSLVIKIADDGKGFDVNNYVSKNGNGIINMKARAEEVNAQFHIQSSAAGTVTTLTASI